MTGQLVRRSAVVAGVATLCLAVTVGLVWRSLSTVPGTQGKPAVIRSVKTATWAESFRAAPAAPEHKLLIEPQAAEPVSLWAEDASGPRLDQGTNAFRMHGRVTERVEIFTKGCAEDQRQAVSLRGEPACRVFRFELHRVPRAELVVAWAGEDHPRRPPKVVGSRFTDAEGHFDLLLEADQPLEVFARWGGRSSWVLNAVHEPGDVCELPLQLPADLGFEGHVLDAEGRALAGASVGLFDMQNRKRSRQERPYISRNQCGGHRPQRLRDPLAVTTDASGWFRLPVSKREEQHLLVEAGDRSVQLIAQVAMPAPRAWFQLELPFGPKGALSGRVLLPDGSPAARAKVLAQQARQGGAGSERAPAGPAPDPMQFVAHTDEAGEFRLDVLDSAASWSLDVALTHRGDHYDASRSDLEAPLHGLQLVLQRRD